MDDKTKVVFKERMLDLVKAVNEINIGVEGWPLAEELVQEGKIKKLGPEFTSDGWLYRRAYALEGQNGQD